MLTLLNGLEEQLLASATVFTAIPAAILTAVTGKWWIATQQNVRNNAQGPQIAALIIIIRFAYK